MTLLLMFDLVLRFPPVACMISHVLRGSIENSINDSWLQGSFADPRPVSGFIFAEKKDEPFHPRIDYLGLNVLFFAMSFLASSNLISSILLVRDLSFVTSWEALV